MPKVQPGNPQWCDWLEEHKMRAEEQGLQSAKTYGIALKSMRACPITYTHPKELTVLKGVGEKIAQYLTLQLKLHCQRTNQPMPEEPAPPPRGYSKGKAPAKRKRGYDQFDVTEEEEKRRAEMRAKVLGLPPIQDDDDNEDLPMPARSTGPPKKKKAAARAPRPYVPAYRSGLWGILLGLYLECTYDDREIWMTKADLQQKAQPYCDAPYDAASKRTTGGTWEASGSAVYSAWSNMAGAETKGLVVTDNKRPKRWRLTEEGYTLAEQLARKENIKLHQPSSETGIVRRPFPIFGSDNAVPPPRKLGSSASLGAAGPSSDLLIPRDEAEEERQLRLAIEASKSDTVKSSSDAFRPAAGPSNARTHYVQPPSRPSLPRPRTSPSSSGSRELPAVPQARPLGGGILDPARAAKGFYAHRPVAESSPAGDLGKDSMFGYFYLDPDDNRVLSRDDAEQCQEEGTGKTAFRIEFRTSQDLHPMVRGLIKKAPMERLIPLPGPATFEAFMRARAAPENAPGFAAKKDSQSKKKANDPFASLLERGDYVQKDKSLGKRTTMYDAPSGIRRLGPAAPTANEDEDEDSLQAGPKTTGAGPSRTLSAPAVPGSGPLAGFGRPRTGIPTATETEALARARSAVLPATSTTEPMAVSYEYVHNQPLVQRHPLDAVADHVSTVQCDFSSFKGDTLRAGTFKIVLVIDSREKGQHKSDPTEVVDKLSRLGILVDRKTLSIGDMIWVARPYGPSGQPTGEEDIVLDSIVERKRLDDLCMSIKDGRYVNQKVRMKESGITDRVYLIEKYQSELHYERFGKQIWTSKSQLQVIDNFFVYEASNPTETSEFLRLRTQVMREMYENEDLHFIPNRFIDRRTYLALQRHLRSTQSGKQYLTTFSAFTDLNEMNASTTLTIRFGKMIQSVSGVSAEKAVSFVQRWPTPRAFWQDVQAERARCEEELRANPYMPDKQKPKPEEYVANELKTGSDRDIKKALSTKIWRLWTDEKYK